MTEDRNMLAKCKLSIPYRKSITFADNNKGKVIGLGRVAITRDKHKNKVMLVESLGYNLVSISKLCDMDMLVLFTKTGCKVIMEHDYSFVFEGI
jgi:hypothetical protein